MLEEIHVIFKQSNLSPGWDTKPWASEYEAEPHRFIAKLWNVSDVIGMNIQLKDINCLNFLCYLETSGRYETKLEN